MWLMHTPTKAVCTQFLLRSKQVMMKCQVAAYATTAYMHGVYFILNSKSIHMCVLQEYTHVCTTCMLYLEAINTDMACHNSVTNGTLAFCDPSQAVTLQINGIVSMAAKQYAPTYDHVGPFW